MKYSLGLIFDGADSWVEISRKSYDDLAEVDRQLKHLGSAEDKFDVTMQNFLEFEAAILQGALRKLSGYELQPGEYLDVERLLARRLSNFLSSAYLYVNTICHHSEGILERDSEGLAKIVAAQKTQQETSLDYRIAVAVRNYSQHRALAVHGLIGTKDADDETGLVDHVEPYLDPDDFRGDRRLPRELLDELPTDGDVINLKSVMRGYMEALGIIQGTFRQEVRSKIVLGLEILLSAQELFEREFPGQPLILLGAVPIPEEGFWGHVIYVNNSIQRIQRHLLSKLPDIVGLRNRSLKY